MKPVFNPYLPLNEYIPDGEPHLFDGRVYIYGSHDRTQGQKYCEDHYVTWSAPEDDLTDWRYEGVIYRRTQDPTNADDKFQLWAPDVTKGPDGRYYLYYCYSFYDEIGVAVSDSPAGPFDFYGHVKYPQNIQDGAVLRDFGPFDPAVLTDDDGRVYLYYGFCPAGEKAFIAPDIPEEAKAAMSPEQLADIEMLATKVWQKYSVVVELEADMLTTKGVPQELIPSEAVSVGTTFEGHGFFEASSIRKFDGKYYFVYSSHKSHELCYATSEYPDRDFVYGGTLVSNGDIGLNGRTVPVCVTGNNHGGLVQANRNYYIFYHRQTNGTEFSRQGCAEKIKMREDGGFDQVEITSCGLNKGPLPASGSYPAAIACHIRGKKSLDIIDYANPIMKETTMVTQTGNRVYVANIEDGSVLGYKYFAFLGADMIILEMRGAFDGEILISTDAEGENVIGEADVHIQSEDWGCELIPLCEISGNNPLYFTFSGNGTLDMKGFSFLSM